MHSQRGMRTCPRRRYFKRCILGVCPGAFVDKSTPTSEMHFNVGCGLVREGGTSSDASSASAPTSSWTSPLLPLKCISTWDADLSAKAVFQAMHPRCLPRRLRGQVHSYLWNAFSTWDADLSAKASFAAMHPRGLPRRLRGQVHSYRWNAFSTWDADLSAKAVFQAMHPRRLPRRFRGQVHSYLWNAFSTWDADLSAKAVFQAMHPRRLPRRFRGQVHSYLWNAFQRGMRTCPRRQYFKRCILGVCHDVFVDKSTPTFGMHSQRGMRTCPRRQYFKRCILGVCHDVFVEKSTPTFGMHFNVGCGLVREGVVCSDASPDCQ